MSEDYEHHFKRSLLCGYNDGFYSKVHYTGIYNSSRDLYSQK